VRISAAAPLISFVILSFGLVSNASADPSWQSGMRWLETMAFAAHQTNYTGTFIYQYGSQVETSRITHVVDRNGEHGRLERLDGKRLEIIRNNDQVWCYVGDHKVRVQPYQGGREFPALLPEQLTLLNQNYQVKLEPGDDRVAGFHAHAILIKPRDSLRYIHKVWAHNDSGLLLKAEVLNDRGDVIEQYAFTQLSIGGNIDRSWITKGPPGNDSPKQSVTSETSTFRTHREPHQNELPQITHEFPVGAKVVPVNSGWRVDGLPPGFKKIAEVSRQIHGKNGPVIQMVYSDGLAGISIFIEKSDHDEDDHPNLFSQGIIQVYSKPVDDHLVTVVGEVPPQTVMQVADSVRYAN
jgi:sigma-E factor negative regulatory protein RseB